MCHQSSTSSTSLDILSEGALSQLLWAPSLAAGKRETRFHSAIQLLIEYLSQVAELFMLNLEVDDDVGAVIYGVRLDHHFFLAID